MPGYAHITPEQWREWHAHHDGSPCAYCSEDILTLHPAPAEERPFTRSQRSMQRLAQVIDDASIEGWRGDGDVVAEREARLARIAAVYPEAAAEARRAGEDRS